MITLEKISRVYTRKQISDDVIALNDVSLTLPESGFVSIVGASGSGKTTLLNVIGGLDKPTSGRMIVDGVSTDNFTDKDWDAYRNEKIGFVLQNCYLLPHLNVRDNVAVKLQISNRKIENIDELVDASLKEVDLLDKKFDKPKALSGGQKQRVAIARAIIGKPTVILADEPTGALDSKTGSQIMEILKKLSKDHLVVMVTHNHEYASKYSDRIIELKDGKITSDSAPITQKEAEIDDKLGKVSIPLHTSLKWGVKNLIVKKYSTISIILASSLGLAGVGLILSISSGVSKTFVDTEERALSIYPVTISSYAKYSSEGSTSEYEEFTDDQYVFVDLSQLATQDHLNYMSDDFLSYMGNMPKEYYNVSYKASATNFNLFTKVNDSTYRKVASVYDSFYKSIDDFDFLELQYDCLSGHFPRGENELALVVDSYNRLTGATLQSLGFDVDTSHYSEQKLTFDSIVGKKYKYVPNNDYYYYDTSTELFSVREKTGHEFYDESTHELTITGIIREKEDSDNPLLKTGIIYNPAFERNVIQNANESDIVVAQKSFGKSKNVITGDPIADVQSGSTTYSSDYVYEALLFNMGAFDRVTTLYYFTKDFESRSAISDYFDKYVSDEEVDFGTLTYNDYLERVTVQFNGAISLMTSVLYAFAVISVIVSAILNAILTYISIHQRTNEIGLLRSLGARKIDIGLMVETESLIAGLFGSILSILLSIILVHPINKLLTGAIYQYKFYLLSSTTFTLPGFQWWVAPIMVGLGLLTALISALIPSIIASKKDPARAINE